MYNHILIDVANLFYRLAANATTGEEAARKMVNWTKNEAMTRLSPEGKLYLLFDPMSYSDLGENKSFYVPLSPRKALLPDYKAGRKYSKIYSHAVELYRKYYIYRNVAVLIYSREYEADDYVEPLLKKLKKESDTFCAALITTDYDWARYIENGDNYKVEMINNSWDKPYTVEDFVEDFEFHPTIAANSVYRAFFGDVSDNIEGAINIKKAKFVNNVKVLIRDYLKFVSDSGATVSDVLKQFKTANFSTINAKEDKSAFDYLYTELYIASLKAPVIEKFCTNLKVICSQLSDSDIEQYIHNNEDRPEVNNIIHQGLFGISFSSQFGRL